MAVLYRYFSPDGGLKTIESMLFLAQDPTTFNDPFEVRPAFDQERHDYFSKTHEGFHAALGHKHSLIAGGSMVGRPTENAADFGDECNRRFREDLSRRFRVICFGRNASNVLMWGHYTSSHKGLVLGIEPSSEGIFPGLAPEGFPVTYAQERIKLPLSYYRGVSVEQYDLSGNITNNPNELVESSGGLAIPFSEYRRQIEEATLRCMTTKARDWSYEEEVRFIYEIKKHHNHMTQANGRWFVKPPPRAFKEVILGARAEMPLVNAVVKTHRAGLFGEAKLFFAWYHPFQYEVQKRETTAEYLLKYYPGRKA